MFSTCPPPDHPLFSLPLKHQRDRLWSVFGPSLLNTRAAPPADHWMPEDSDLTLLAWRDSGVDYYSPRLGFCFEQLWQSALHLCGETTLPNQQIIEGQQTLGELDLLITSHDPVLHLELALKFYLGVEHDWVGPNQRDLLSQKLARTFEHQLPLAQLPATRNALSELGIGAVESVAVMRGCLFHPAHGLRAAPLPDEIADNHWKGFWAPVSQCDGLLPLGRWYVLSKPDWLSPVLANFAIEREELLIYLQTYFRYLRTPLAIARMAQGRYGWAEQERWMIVADDWWPEPERS